MRARSEWLHFRRRARDRDAQRASPRIDRLGSRNPEIRGALARIDADGVKAGDPTMIDFEPSEEQALIIETVHQFAENEIRPHCREADESGVPPKSVVEAAHELGLIANGLPEAQGGGGDRSAVTGALIAEELAWGDLAIALAILSPGLVGFPVADHGSESQRNEILPGLMDGGFVPGSLAIVEPRFDFDCYHPHTTAKQDGQEIILDGAKCQVPWLAGGRHVIVVAQRIRRAGRLRRAPRERGPHGRARAEDGPGRIAHRGPRRSAACGSRPRPGSTRATPTSAA